MNNQQNKNKNKLKVILVVLLGILCVLLVLFLGIVIGTNRQKTENNTPTATQGQPAENTTENTTIMIPDETGQVEDFPVNGEIPYEDTATADTDNQSEIDLNGEPVAILYKDGGKTVTVPLEEVSNYRDQGWLPLHKYVFEASQEELEKHVGTLELVNHYAGTPNSGDVPTDDYTTSETGSLYIPKISYWTDRGECVYVKFRLQDVFPFLALYADPDGNVSVEDVNKAFSRSGIYGTNYRVTGDASSALGTFNELNYIDGYNVYDFVYDDVFATITTDESGTINMITSYCSFTTLP